MALDAKVSALTAALKTEFWKSWDQVAEPADWEAVTTVLPSTTKIENYLNATPVPAFQRWSGMRTYAQTDTFVFQVRNETWHSEIMARLEDIEDDQTGILMTQPKNLVAKGKQFPGRMVFKLLGQGIGSLAAGTIAYQGVSPVGNTNSLVDNLAFFGTRVIGGAGFGTGTNLITYNSASGDGKTYNLAALYFGEGLLKPLAWQNRSGPAFETNSGSPMSKENRSVRWWCDLRGAPFFGYWWNAVGVNIVGTPNVAEMHAIYSAVIAAFRSFAYPRTASTEDGEYIHEQTTFSSKNLMYVGSTYLSEQLRQSLGQEWVPQNVGSNSVATTNLWYAAAKWTVSRFLDNF
jgi:phage major head subunit gpT-like protein